MKKQNKIIIQDLEAEKIEKDWVVTNNRTGQIIANLGNKRETIKYMKDFLKGKV